MKLFKQSNFYSVNDIDCEHGDEDGDGKCDNQIEKEIKLIPFQHKFVFNNPNTCSYSSKQNFRLSNEQLIGNNFSRLDYCPPESLA